MVARKPPGSLGPELWPRLPFFYGWVIVACAILAAFARQGAAVATLSVFVEPMSADFGWSRTALSGAVSLGGLLGALTAPAVGRLVDRHGARLVLGAGALVVGLAAGALSQTTSLAWFYAAFALGRLTFASPFDIGISAAVASWFVRRRAQAMGCVTVGSTLGLAVMPLLAYAAIHAGGWRSGWLAVAAAVLVAGGLPNLLLMRRRPEDLGLEPDGAPPVPPAGGPEPARPAAADAQSDHLERHYSRAEAVRTPALWLLMAYTALVFPVQAGISLHQASHIVHEGFSAGVAATVVSTYSLAAAVGGLGFGFAARRWPIRVGLAAAAGLMALSALAMASLTGSGTGAGQAYLAAALFGVGIGGVLTLVPVVWADYYGRRNYGAIRGATLPVQVIGQAAGPLLAGVLFDHTGSYRASFLVLGACGAAAALVVLLARPPRGG